jgi:hypothetical protein
MVEQRLDGLREAVRAAVEVAAARQRTPFDELAGRAARRRQRRRRITGAAAATVLGAGLLFGWAATARQPSPVTTPNPRPTGDRLIVRSLDFATVDRGYALVLRCPVGPYQCASHSTLLTTGDGGRTWSRVPSPADNSLTEQTGIDATTAGGGVALSLGSARYASTDRGATWAPIRGGGSRGPVTGSLPDGWYLIQDTNGRLAAFDPVRNLIRPLAHQPPGLDTRGGWTIGTGPAGRVVQGGAVGGHPAVAWSGDRARTWHLAALPAGVRATIVVALADPASQRVYLILGDEMDRMTGIWRLDRPGAGWVQVPLPGKVAAAGGPGMMKAIRMLPDGELFIGLNDPLRTEDGGTRVVPFGTVLLDGVRQEVNDPWQSIGDTLYATVPPDALQPVGVLTVLVSTDSGRTWTVRRSRP